MTRRFDSALALTERASGQNGLSRAKCMGP